VRAPSYGGLVVAALFLAASLTPSLVPRHWVFQGAVVGVVTAAGYGIGTLAVALLRGPVRHRLPPRYARLAWRASAIAGLIGLALLARQAIGWQQELHRLMGMEVPAGGWYLLSILLGLVLAMALVATGRAVRWLDRRLNAWFTRWLPSRISSAVGIVVVTALVVGLFDGLVNRVLFDVADETFRLSDRSFDGRSLRPVDPLRSGSPASAVRWTDLGSQGRNFVSGGPTTRDLAAFADAPATPPIRVYVGLDAAEDDRERARMVVEELERTGAFERAVLCVITATGTGWVDPEAAAALEYLWSGDTALATMQYSYLPSWLSLLVDSGRAREAGDELFDAVYERWRQFPEDARPRLVVFGESLGVDGSEAAFSGVADLRNRVDGALWVGPPNFSALWRAFTERRDPGTPERLPVYGGGATVRFAAEADDLREPEAPWATPRVVYLQHPSDPVVWWSPRLILRRPDWLEEPQGPDVLPEMRWYPLVTFWQLTADLANAERVPPGHGHGYGALVADAWAAILPPDGWSDHDTTRLRDVVAEQLVEREGAGDVAALDRSGRAGD